MKEAIMSDKKNYRKMYLDKEITHDEYYLSIAEYGGLSIRSEKLLAWTKKEVEKGNHHLSAMAFDNRDLKKELLKWENVFGGNVFVQEYFEAHGDFQTPAGLVCLAKAVAKRDSGGVREETLPF